jgi:methyltransferase (TIGR00027 family)
MTKELLIRDVSDTAFWVAHYRAKETERNNAIFQDPYAKRLVGERGQQISDSMTEISKYTEWAVVSRTVIIDRLIEKMVQEGVDAIINLGAGLDARPYRLNLPPHLEWIEVDCASIISHKTEILRANQPRCKLTRFAIDLTKSEERKAFLNSVAPQAKKALVLTEGVIPYLTPEQVTDLANDLHASSRFAYWITEYFHHRVYRYLKDSVRMRALKNAPFQFYPDDWFGFFKNLGWVEKETRYSGEIAHEFKRMPPMPWFAKLLMPFLPKKVKRQAGRMAGFVLFEKAHS